jgi:hypothetical protein
LGDSIVLKALALGVLVGVLGSFRAKAQDFCAVTLNVTEPGGKPIGSTWIELVDASGKVVRREMIRGSEARICDFGFGANSIRVGTNECLPTTISNLRVVIGFPIHLDVTLNACGYREQMRNACFVYFRTQDEAGGPVPGVDLSPRLTDVAPKTDSYGRYQSLFRGTRDVVFTKPGFVPTSIHLECQSDEEIDKSVTMSRDRPAR